MPLLRGAASGGEAAAVGSGLGTFRASLILGQGSRTASDAGLIGMEEAFGFWLIVPPLAGHLKTLCGFTEGAIVRF
jgi:hypothetical protein